MSTITKFRFCLITAIVFVFGGSFAAAAPVRNKVLLEIEVGEIRVKLQSADGISKSGTLDFIDSYADATGLSGRVSEVSSEGRRLERTGAGRFAIGDNVKEISYLVTSLKPTESITAPHVSWVSNDFGLINLTDVVPSEVSGEFDVALSLPDGWTSSGGSLSSKPNTYRFSDKNDGVILVGRAIRRLDAKNFAISVVGQWQYSDSEARRMTSQILGYYEDVFSKSPRTRKQVFLLPFPAKMPLDRWRAETRGNTATIVSTQSAYKNIGVQRLHEQLRHELFHFWIPNDVDINGEYAWFYEGFARYQSLKAALALRQIRFEDYLRTLSEATQIAARRDRGKSLKFISENQWVAQSGSLAARSTLFAFLSDLKIVSAGKKQGAGALLRKFYKRFAKGRGKFDQEDLEQFLRDYPEIKGLYDDHVLKNKEIEWESLVSRFGLTFSRRGGRSFFSRKQNTSRRERAMLKNLGYNGV